MEKKLFGLAFAMSVLYVTSCQNDYTDVLNTDIPKNIESAQDAAVREALGFVTSLNVRTRGTSDATVSTVYPWLRQDIVNNATRAEGGQNMEDTLFYIVNFTNDNGYAIVSANNFYSGVVAYIENGSLSPNDEIQSPEFRCFLDGLYSPLSYDPIFPPTPLDTTFIKYYPEDSVAIPWSIDSIVPPILRTKWHQHSPFNDLCYTTLGEQALAGCAPVAMGQVFSSYQMPLSNRDYTYNWSEMLPWNAYIPLSTTGRESVATLIHDIGVISYTSYGVESSSTLPVSIPDCLAYFGYTYAYTTNITFNLCKSSLNQGRPILFGGYGNYGGHMWVVDGYIVRYCMVDNDGNIADFSRQRLLHCNWGWGGAYNGYFLFNVFTLNERMMDDNQNNVNNNGADNVSFNSNKFMYYNLRINDR